MTLDEAQRQYARLREKVLREERRRRLKYVLAWVAVTLAAALGFAGIAWWGLQ